VPDPAINLLREIIAFDIDGAPKEELIKRAVSLSKDEFLEELYVPHPNEDEIKDLLFTSDQISCVVGVKGSGKTTVISKLLHKNIPKGVAFIKINFDKEAVNFDTPDSDWSVKEKWLRTSKKRLIALIRKKLFATYLRNYDEELEEFCRRLMGEESITEMEAVYHDVRNHRIEARNLMVRSKFKGKFEEFLFEEENADLTLYINKFMVKNLSLVQLFWFMYDKKICDRIILVFDQVDSLPNAFQPYYLHIAVELHQSLQEFVRCVIAIRKENIHRPSQYSQGGNAIFMRLVYIQKSEEHEIVEKSAVEIGEPDMELMERILEQRTKLFDKLGAIIPEASVVSKIVSITKKIYQTYLSEKFYRIANGSLRSMLDFHASFIEFILSEVEDLETLVRNQSDDPDRLGSLFYRWLVTVGERTLAIKLYNPVEALSNWTTSKIGCFPQYLILGFLYNRKHDPSKRHYYYSTVSEIVDELVILGYEEEEIISDIFKLHSFGQRPGQLIEMRSKELTGTISADSMSLGDHLWITPRGEESIESCSHKFFYVMEQINSRLKQTRDKFTFDDYVARDLKYITLVSKIHQEGLRRVRDIYEDIYGNGWYDVYCQRFCIKLAGKHRPQLSILIFSHLTFMISIGKHDFSKLYESLYKQYKINISEIVQYGRARNKRIRVSGPKSRFSNLSGLLELRKLEQY